MFIHALAGDTLGEWGGGGGGGLGEEGGLRREARRKGQNLQFKIINSSY